jgi:glutathione peroxidase-family protein
VEDYINVLKEQIPESINNCEHIFFPCIEGTRFDIVEKPQPENIKHVLYITLRNNSTGQKDDEYIKNFRKFIIKNLNNTLEYFEILINYYPEQDYTSFYIINLK